MLNYVCDGNGNSGVFIPEFTKIVGLIATLKTN